jgi:uncharacterized protein (DUF924 family)
MQTTLSITSDSSPIIDEVLDFWFERPARDAAELLAKFRRWYQAGDVLDEPIRQRFGTFVERALDGRLNWQSSERGRLALILLLDQFTRNAYRGTPRAYAGDSRARYIALGLIGDAAYQRFSCEERLFVTMPLVHSESVMDQRRAVELAERLACDAAPQFQDAWRLGCERTRHYLSVIERFGRFPARNAILGRQSSPEELAFLEQEANQRSPLT